MRLSGRPAEHSRFGARRHRRRPSRERRNRRPTLTAAGLTGGPGPAHRASATAARGRQEASPVTSSVSPILSIERLSKTYAGGHRALNEVSLAIAEGEIFALLGPNGAGKTTLIGAVCGLVTPTSGRILAGGFDVVKDYRAARSLIGLVPQELHTESFETVWAAVRFSRGLFGKPKDDAHLERVLKDLSLWDKKDAKIQTLSGGMKRRVMIAKALAHEPRILFLDEPTAGVDVELRRDMWAMVRRLRKSGVTIILTTHYIEEAEDMADRVGVISKGELVLVEQKTSLMSRFGKKTLTLTLETPIAADAPALAGLGFQRSDDGRILRYVYDAHAGEAAMGAALRGLIERGVAFADLATTQSSLEDIFVELVHGAAQ
ncbi:MAG: ABC transporter ATP-binding protein [Alphaproteobacteria bacterium]|nr:ABC transporter ATP-binding protein [Alphaproteobacteria bacterium]